jgi:lysophospholipase L1-like esterase
MRRWLVRGVVFLVLAGAASVLSLTYGSRYAAFHLPEIRSIEARATEAPPESGTIIFTGSSSIRTWETLGRDMAPLPVLNHGFGGSQLSHVLHYAPQILFPYHPRIIVVYAGDNDLAGGPKTPTSVANDFSALVDAIRAEVPDTRVFFLSIKPSIARIDRWPEMEYANRLIQEICDGDSRLSYVDVATPMLDADGKPREELFSWDGLHMNEEGYALWTSIVRPRVEREWRRLQRQG